MYNNAADGCNQTADVKRNLQEMHMHIKVNFKQYNMQLGIYDKHPSISASRILRGFIITDLVGMSFGLMCHSF